MKRILSIALALGVAFAARAADLSEYVSDGLVAMWDGYRNLGADKPHDSYTNVWYDTTGTYGFTLTGGFMGDICCKFSLRGGGYGYGVLSAEDTAATFGQATDGTVEIVYSKIGYSNTGTTQEVLLQSSAASGVAIGGTSSLLLTTTASGCSKYSYAHFNRFNSVAVHYTAGKSVAAFADGAALEANGSDYYGSATTETFLGNRASKGAGFTGYIFAIRVYSRQLTAAELAQNAAADRERYFNRKLNASSSYAAVDYAADLTADTVIEVSAEKSVNAAHDEAVAYLAENAGKTALVKIPAGEFVLTAGLTLASGEMLVGAGWDKTFLNAKDIGFAVSGTPHAITVGYANNLVRGLAVTKLVEGALSNGTGTGQRVFKVTAGTVDRCRSTFNRGQYGGTGMGFEITGGTVTNCLVDHTSLNNMSKNGLGVAITGGLLTDSEICYTDSSLGRSMTGCGLYVGGANAVVRRCRIHDCGKPRIYGAESAVHLANGTIENSLVYGNLCNDESQAATLAAGVVVKGGTLRYSTVFNNRTSSETTGLSGLQQSGGTVRNCIFSHNYTDAHGVQVTGGTFDHNVVNASVTGYADNYVSSDPRFRDLGANDVHVAAKASPAVGRATPVADVATDYDNVARDAEKPTVGAFEYVASAADFTADLSILQSNWREGSSPSVELIVDGVADPSKLSVDWYVDGEEVPELADELTPVFEGMGLGTHTVKAVATYDTKTLEPEAKNGLVVQPVKTYVSEDGSDTFPYDTAAKAAHTLAAAFDAVWKDVGEATSVELAAGTFALGDTLYVDAPVSIVGAGSDRTTVTGLDSTDRLVTLAHAGARLEGLALTGAVTGGGVEIAKGLVNRCRIADCRSALYDCRGSGVLVGDGSLLNSEIADCRSYNTYGYSGGIALTESTSFVSNCTVRGCYVHCSHRDDGGGVYMSGGGLLTHCRITDCGDHKYTETKDVFSTVGGAIYVAKGMVRNVLVDNSSSTANSVVYACGGSFENCTFTANRTADGVPAVSLASSVHNPQTGWCELITMTNSVAWGNSGPDLVRAETIPAQLASERVGYSCWPEAEEGVGGNTARNPHLTGASRGYAVRGHGPSRRGGLVLGWMADGWDLSGRPRTTRVNGVEKVDFGCQQDDRASLGAVVRIGALAKPRKQLFEGADLTQPTAVPTELQSAEYRLSFDLTFPQGATNSVILYQYFPRNAGGTDQIDMHTCLDFKTGLVRTLGFVEYNQYTGSPWFNGGWTDYSMAKGETRHVEVVAHDGCVSYFLEFNGGLYRCKTDLTYAQFKLQALKFAGLGEGADAVRVSNVQIENYEPSMLPAAREGFTITDGPTTWTIPVAGDRTRFKLIPGGYPVEINLRFVDGGVSPAYKIKSLVQSFSGTDQSVTWEDSGLALSGTAGAGTENLPSLYTRTRLRYRYMASQLPDILANVGEYGEKAAGHAFDFDVQKRDGRYRLWIDGEFFRELAVTGALDRIELDVPQSAQLKVESAEMPSLAATAEPLPDREPFAVAKCRENLGSYSIEHDGYRSRLPTDGMPDCYLRRVPVGTYVKAKVRCRLGGDTNRNTKVTARLTRFGVAGDMSGTSPDAWTQQTKEIVRSAWRGTYDVEFDFDAGKIQDLISQYGYEALHFEVLGGAKRQSYFSASEGKPTEDDPSDVIVVSAELVHAPAGLAVFNGSFGNLFYAETEPPNLTARVDALVGGDYTVNWQVKDVAGTVIETYADALSLTNGEVRTLAREFAARTPGWYEVVTTLAADGASPCVTRTSSFVLQPPDTRTALWDSPYFAWAPLSIRNGTDKTKWAPWVGVFRRFGIRKTTLPSTVGEDFFPDYPMTRSPLGHLGINTSTNAAERLAAYEAKVTALKALYPHADMATVLHENSAGVTPVLETIGGTTVIDEAQHAEDLLWTLRATEIASTYRSLWPEMRLSLGNSGNSLGISSELYRGGMDPALIDYVGEETTGASTPAEENAAVNFWTIREQARAFGYDQVKPCACYEWKSRPRRQFNSLRILAATEVRDALVAHAWRSPSITVDAGPEPYTCYFATSWGGGAFTREPLLQPTPKVAAVSTMTRVLDSCTFVRMVPTGSYSVYCLEFTRGGEYVYALWTARGTVRAAVASTASSPVRTILYGASQAADLANVEIGEEPCYLTMDAPVSGFTLASGNRQYPFDTYPGMEDAQELARFDAEGKLTPTAAPGVLGAARGLLPVNVPGDLSLAFVADEEKGTVAEMTLNTDEPVPSPLFKEYGFVALATPVAIPETASTLAIDVKGNSCGGKVYLTIEDAEGKKWVAAGRGGDGYYDQCGQMSLNFDGWCRLSFILTDASPVKNHSVFDDTDQWRRTDGNTYVPMTPPFKFTGFGVSLKRQTLNLVEMEPSTSLSVRFAAISAY